MPQMMASCQTCRDRYPLSSLSVACNDAFVIPILSLLSAVSAEMPGIGDGKGMGWVPSRPTAPARPTGARETISNP
ncbi:hypothetical protein GCM10009678_33880 [Actinomadura kijaniata]